MNVKQTFEQLIARKEVPDFNVEKASVIFVLESPHTHELLHGVPVAGSTGKAMAKKLFSKAQPLGLLLKDHSLGVASEHIGLMNVCQIPMQESAYNEQQLSEFEEFISKLEYLRTANQKDTFKNNVINELQAVIVGHLKTRLYSIQNKQVVIVPCGRFAQKFVRLVWQEFAENAWDVIEEVPHPSYNSWSKERYKEQINQLLDKLIAMGIITHRFVTK